MDTFEFLRPAWLLGIPVLFLFTWYLTRRHAQSAWASYIPTEKLKHLLVSHQSGRKHWRSKHTIVALGLGWVLTCVALAGPTWQKLPLPVMKNRQAMIILFDLSVSMLANDIAPDRVTRGRLKVIDLLRQREDGETGLIAYAGDAHRVAPLTDDPATIENLVPTLHPNIMPVSGSNIEAAVSMAVEMLNGAELQQGDLVLLTDGVDPQAVQTIRETLGASYRLSIIGIGSTQGAPIPTDEKGFVRNQSNQIVVASLDRSTLQQLAASQGGSYIDIQADDSDLKFIKRATSSPFGMDFKQQQEKFDTKVDAGYWLVLLLLPLALFGFRRNLIWCLLVVPLLPKPAQALDWSDLWLTRDQQAARALEQGDAAAAAQKFKSKQWSGVARYRNNEYQGAVDQFATGAQADNHYNRGNALALSGKLEDAIAAYNESLTLDPNNTDAEHNRKIVEALLKQQQEQKEQQNQEQEQGKDQDPQQGENQDQQDPNQDQKNKEQQQQQEQSAQNDGEKSNNAQNSKQDGSDSREETPQQTPEQQGQSTSDNDQEQKSETQEQEAAQQEDSEEQESEQTPESVMASQTDKPKRSPLSQSSEQWLRSVPHDPGGLMRRKFEYQSRVRQRKQPGNNTERF